MNRQEAIAILEDNFGMAFSDAQEFTNEAFYNPDGTATDPDHNVSIRYSDADGYTVE